MLFVAIFGLGCNILNLIILQCCCNQKDANGKDMHLFESIASAYKPMHGNKISNAIKSIKSKSQKGSVFSKNASVLDNYDADAASKSSLI